MLRRATALKRICDRQRVQNAKALKLYYNKNKEWENNLEEQIKKIKSDSITKF